MKNTQKNDKKNEAQALQLPQYVVESCGFDEVECLTVKSTEGVCIIHKSGLTVLETAHIIAALSELASDMTAAIALKVGICDGCGEPQDDAPADCVAGCELCQDLLAEDEIVRVPGYLLEEAGIPEGSKLVAYADEENGEVTVMEADAQEDITDLPPAVVAVLAAAGVCLAELNECILLGEIVYGE